MKKISKLLSLLICNCILFTSCGLSGAEVVTVSQDTEVVVNVLYQNPIYDTISEETTYIGRIQPDETVNVMPKLAGEVLIANYSVGDYVQQGALLLKIDDSDIITSINVAQSGYNASAQSISQSEGSMTSQALSVDQQVDAAQLALDNAIKTLDNFNINNALDSAQETLTDLYYEKRLVENRISTIQECIDNIDNNGGSSTDDDGEEDPLDRSYYIAQLNYANMELYEIDATISYTREELSSASNTIESTRLSYQSQVDSARLQLENAQKSQEVFYSTTVGDTTNVLTAQLDQAAAQLEQTQSQLKNTTVTSPVSGVVLEKNISVSEMASQSSIAYVISNNNTAVTFGVTQTVAQTLSIGEYITFEEGNDVYQARIVEIASQIDNSSGLFTVKALVDLEGRSLLSGVAVKVTATTNIVQNIQTIPSYSLYYDGQLPYVYVIDAQNKAKKVYIEIGLIGDYVVEVISGLEDNDKVVTSWNANLLEGVSVVGELDSSVDSYSSEIVDEDYENDEDNTVLEGEEDSTNAD